ncbi:hypothetical protein N431DRAFT_487404 [Stipitochalara longipes BDJ]|nr:hypothetical protein N431DRAFT_487404 [Stipitochalara longipes BDJ]
MAVKIDLEKVVGPNNKEPKSQPFLPQLVSSTIASWRTWQTRIPRPLRSPQALWSLIVLALLAQALTCWRIFFPPSPEYATSPPYNATENVHLVTEYYRLLQDLRYLGRNSITYPPHRLARHKSHSLPYVISHEDRINITGGYLTEAELTILHESDEDWYLGWMTQERDIFWQNGHFLDYRNDAHLLASRDPLQRYYIGFSPAFSWYDAMIEYDAIPKSAIPLSFITGRKYGLSIVLDTANGRLVVLDAQGSGNRDPLILNQNWEKMPFEYRIGTKYYDNEVSARLANDFLKELIVHTVTLDFRYIPGSVRVDEFYTPELNPPRWERWIWDLYNEYGWPRGDALKDCRYGYFGFPWVEKKLCDADPLKELNGTGFDTAMRKLRHKIEVQYMPDWYCPVPREPELIDALKNYGALTEEQIAFAESDESKIVEKLEGWAKNLAFMQN